MSRRRQRDRYHSLRIDPEAFDGLSAHGLAIGDDHGGDAESDQQRRAPPDAIGGVVPGGSIQGERSCSVSTLGRDGR